MSESSLVLGATIPEVDTVTELYESPATGAGTVISAFTVTNNTASSASFKAYIYGSTGDALLAIAPMTVVVPDAFSATPSAVNHVVPPGGTIRAENSAADSLVFNISGRQQ